MSPRPSARSAPKHRLRRGFQTTSTCLLSYLWIQVKPSRARDDWYGSTPLTPDKKCMSIIS